MASALGNWKTYLKLGFYRGLVFGTITLALAGLFGVFFSKILDTILPAVLISAIGVMFFIVIVVFDMIDTMVGGIVFDIFDLRAHIVKPLWRLTIVFALGALIGSILLGAKIGVPLIIYWIVASLIEAAILLWISKKIKRPLSMPR